MIEWVTISRNLAKKDSCSIKGEGQITSSHFSISYLEQSISLPEHPREFNRIRFFTAASWNDI